MNDFPKYNQIKAMLCGHQAKQTRSQQERQLKRCILFSVVTAAAVATPFLAQAACTRADRKRFPAEGRMIDLDGERMHLYARGIGSQTIVFLPSYHTPDPAIDFMPLVRRLSSEYRCVVPEPLGAGYSDDTSRPRTVKNQVNEIREALHLAGFRPPYVLLGHASAGLAMLYWASKYSGEVSAVIGEDSFVPSQGELPDFRPRAVSKLTPLAYESGLLRLMLACGYRREELLRLTGGDPRRLRQVRALSAKNWGNEASVDQAARLAENCRTVSRLRFPNQCKLLLFVSEETRSDCLDYEVRGGYNWLAEHEKQALQVQHGRCVLLNGGHYLHWTCADEMARSIRSFLRPQSPEKRPVFPRIKK